MKITSEYAELCIKSIKNYHESIVPQKNDIKINYDVKKVVLLNSRRDYLSNENFSKKSYRLVRFNDQKIKQNVEIKISKYLEIIAKNFKLLI